MGTLVGGTISCNEAARPNRRVSRPRAGRFNRTAMAIGPKSSSPAMPDYLTPPAIDVWQEEIGRGQSRYLGVFAP